jgi:hypothetical protein
VKRCTVFAVVATAALSVFSADIVNGRVVPTKSDFSSFGEAGQFYLYDTLFTEMLPILSAARNKDAIDVDSARATTINSTTGNISNAVVDSISFGAFDVSAVDTAGTDSLAITINGVKYWITPTSTE